MSIYYFSHTLGSDSNSGLNPAQPHKSLGRATGHLSFLFNAGHTCLLAAGDVWEQGLTGGVATSTIDVTPTVHAGQYIGMYDAGLGSDRPRIDSMVYQSGADDGLWTNIGSNRWTCDIVTSYAALGVSGVTPRIWPGITNKVQPLHRSPQRYKGTSAASVNAIGDYVVSSGVITMYSPSGAPPSYYGGLAIGVLPSTASGYPSTQIRVQNLQGESFLHGLTLRGSTNTWTMRGSANFDVYIEKMIVEGPSGGGPTLHTTGTDSIQRFRGYDCNVDYFTSLDEGTIENGGQDGFQVDVAPGSGALTSDVEWVDCNVRGARHTSVSFQYTNEAYPNQLNGLIFRATKKGRSVLDQREANYGRAFGLIGTGWRLQNIIIRGQPTQSQFDGSGVISACEWRENMDRDVDNNAAGNGGGDSCIVISLSTATDAATTHKKIRIEGTLFENPSNFAIRIGDFTGNPFPVGAIEIEGNTFIDLLHYNNKRRQNSTSVTPMVFSVAGESATVASVASTYFAGQNFPTYRNNVFIIPPGKTGCYGYSTGTTSITSYAVNTGPGGGFPTPVGDMKFHDIAAAGLSAPGYLPSRTSPLIGQGVHNSYNRDGRGKVRRNPPTVGAFD
jgi:hypothetical protein